MIANAGIIVTKTLLEVSVEEWDRVMAVSLFVTCTCLLYRKNLDFVICPLLQRRININICMGGTF